MKKMQLQALATDAAIQKLGLSLDQLSTRNKLSALSKLNQGLGDVRSETRNVNVEGDRASRTWRRMDNDARRLSGTSGTLGRRLKSVGGELKSILMLGGKIGVMGAGVGVLVQSVGALAGGLVGLLPKLSDLVNVWPVAISGVAGMVGAIATLKIAFGGLSKAMGGDLKALRELGPEGHRVVRTLRGMRGELRLMRRDASEGIFKGVSSALRDLRGAEPVIRAVLRDMSSRLGGLISEGAKRFSSPGNLRDFRTVMGQGGGIISDMGHGLMNLGAAFRDLAVAAGPFTRWISQGILNWTKHYAATQKAARETGVLAAKFDRAKAAMQTLGRFLHLTWDILKLIGQAARPLGDLLWGAANRSLAGWLKVHDTVAGRAGLTASFLKMAPAVKAIARLVGDLGKAVFNMGQSQVLAHTVDSLRGLIPALEKVLTVFADTFGPQTVQAITTLSSIFEQMGTGPLQIVFSAINGILTLIDKIMHLMGPFKSLIGTAFSTLVIARFLVKLGILEKGWLSAAFAARTYAGAVALATGAGMVGGGGPGVILGPRGRLFGRLRGRGAGAAVSQAEYAAGPAGLARTGGIAQGVGRAGMGTRALGMGKLALGAAGKVALPLMAIQAGIGALTAPRSGGIGNQIGQTAFGGLNALAFGQLGNTALGRHFMTPDQRDAAFQQKSTRQLGTDMAEAGRGRQGVARLTAEIQVLNILANDVRQHQTETSRAYLEQLNAEISARKNVVSQLNAEAGAKGHRQGSAAIGRMNKLAPRGTSPRATQAVLSAQIASQSKSTFAARRDVGQAAIAGIQSRIAAGEQGLGPVLSAITSQVVGIERAHGNKGARIGQGGHLFLGTRAEFNKINSGMRNQNEVLREIKSGGMTVLQRQMVDHLQARGMAKAVAIATVLGAEPRPRKKRDGSVELPEEVIARMKPAASGQVLGAGLQSSFEFMFPFRKRPGAGSGAGARAAGTRAAGNNAAAAGPGLGSLGSGSGGGGTLDSDFGSKFAVGGRAPGRGLADTVPAMLAPGELVVNRHQEAAADSALGGRGRLDGIVHGINKPHRENFQKGGRTAAPANFQNVNVLSKVGYQRAAALGRYIAGLGYRVGEHPAFGGVSSGYHVRNSYHWVGQAVDVNAENMAGGEMAALDKLYWKLKKGAAALNLSQLIWRAKGHWNHLHAATLPMVGGRGTYFPDAQGIGSGSGIGAAAGVTASDAPVPGSSPTGPTGPVGPRGAGQAGPPASPKIGQSSDTRQVQLAQQQKRLWGIGGIDINPGVTEGAGGGGAGKGKGKGPGKGAGKVPDGGTPTGNRAIGRKMMLAYGYPASEWPALDTLWQHESGWDERVPNHQGSGAYGIPQALPADKMATAGKDWRTNPATQIKWGLGYIHGSYGTPTKAWEFWQRTDPRPYPGNWYQKGGRTPQWGGWHAGGLDKTFSSPTVIGVGEGGKSERVTVTPTGGKGGGSKVEIHAVFNINGGEPGQVQREIEMALRHFAEEIEQQPYNGESDIS